MKLIVQRVSRASVEVCGAVVGEIGAGLLALVGCRFDDTEKDAAHLAAKMSALRIFQDPDGKMNLSVKDVDGEILLVSEFTLCGDVRKGKRPNFGASMGFTEAEKMYDYVADEIRKLGFVVQTGVFGAMMKVDISNDGPVTILLDSRKMF